MGIFWAALPAATRAASFEYISPVPGASMVSTGNNIILRDGRPIDARSLHSALLAVRGSQSGKHDGRLILSDDSKTLVFTPDLPFAPGENVSVQLVPGLRTIDQAALPDLKFEFRTTTVSQEHYAALCDRTRQDECLGQLAADGATNPRSSSQAAPLPPVANLPANYPDIVLLTSDDPDPGNVFLTPWYRFAQDEGRLTILDNEGLPLFYRHGNHAVFDLKLQNGLLTYVVYFKAFALDSTYAKVDSFQTGNGYQTDIHDFQWLPNHHSLLLAYDPQPVRMDLVVPGGNPNAIVTGLIVQELDAAKNVVFQWRSWDHFQITDASVSGLVSLTDSLIDYVHGNAVELDFDGNLLISSRHMNEITKINRATGNTVWRLGLNAAHNDFTFVNDARGFSHQHDIRRLPNKNITLFDNGNFLTPQYSRGVEYKLNENSHRATLVWKYEASPPIFGGFMGNVQRLPSGNTMIGWVARRCRRAFPSCIRTRPWPMGWGFRRCGTRTGRFASMAHQCLVTSREKLDFGRVVIGGSRTIPMSVRNNTTTA
jgi:hypothetical protein